MISTNMPRPCPLCPALSSAKSEQFLPFRFDPPTTGTKLSQAIQNLHLANWHRCGGHVQLETILGCLWGKETERICNQSLHLAVCENCKGACVGKQHANAASVQCHLSPASSCPAVIVDALQHHSVLLCQFQGIFHGQLGCDSPQSILAVNDGRCTTAALHDGNGLRVHETSLNFICACIGLIDTTQGNATAVGVTQDTGSWLGAFGSASSRQQNLTHKGVEIVTTHANAGSETCPNCMRIGQRGRLSPRSNQLGDNQPHPMPKATSAAGREAENGSLVVSHVDWCSCIVSVAWTKNAGHA